MVQLKSDLYRQQAYMDASLNAKREATDNYGPSPLYERLAEIREKEAHRSSKKRGFPIMIILSLLSFSYFVFFGKDMMQESMPAIQQKVIEAQIKHGLQNGQNIQGMQGLSPEQTQQRIQAMQNLQAAHNIQDEDLQAEQQAAQALNTIGPQEKATITVQVGGQTITREMTLQEIQQMHMMSGQMQ